MSGIAVSLHEESPLVLECLTGQHHNFSEITRHHFKRHVFLLGIAG